MSFLASLLFGDLLVLPVDLYYLIYFAIIGAFLAFYVRSSRLDIGAWARRRLAWAILLGVVVGILMVRNVYTRPPTEPLEGGLLVWALVWRGLAYGLADGLILFAFPWIVVWRALGADGGKLATKVRAGVLAWVGILIVTTAYHLGYADFRSPKIVQPNIGSTIVALPTLLAANPLASPISHVFLHTAAVIHSPQTDLFLPPHRD